MDPIADLLTQLRNAYLIRKEEVTTRASKMKKALLDVLVREKFVERVTETETEGGHPQLVVTLRYRDQLPAIRRIRRVSRPGRRVYTPTATIPKPKSGIGTMILSTPRGIMTTRQAQKERVGGEIICEVIRGA